MIRRAKLDGGLLLVKASYKGKKLFYTWSLKTEGAQRMNISPKTLGLKMQKRQWPKYTYQSIKNKKLPLGWLWLMLSLHFRCWCVWGIMVSNLNYTWVLHLLQSIIRPRALNSVSQMLQFQLVGILRPVAYGMPPGICTVVYAFPFEPWLDLVTEWK